jgi:ATP-dependent DNA ligase
LVGFISFAIVSPLLKIRFYFKFQRSKVSDNANANQFPTTIETTAVGGTPSNFLLKPLTPMLSTPCKNLVAAMSLAPFYAEKKYDGERLQIHKKDNEIK